MSSTLDNYRQRYLLGSVILEEKPRRLIIDQHQSNTIDTSQPVFVLDLDHTILNTNALKDLLRHSLVEFDISPEQFDQTYKQAKNEDNFYDFNQHLQLLANLIAPVHQVSMVPTKIEEFLFQTIEKSASQLIYPNIKNWLEQSKPRNVLIMTSGVGEWQRYKVSACLQALNWEPQAVLLVERTHKGWVVNKLFQLIQSPEYPEPTIVILDDNETEIEDMATKAPLPSVRLIRIKQPNGQYNDLKTDTKLGIQELDCTQQNTDLTKFLTSIKTVAPSTTKQ